MRTFHGLTAIRTGTPVAAVATVILVGVFTVFRAEATGGAPETWPTPAALNTNAVTDTGRDAEVELATDGKGNWVAVWNSREDLFDCRALQTTEPLGLLLRRSTPAPARTWAVTTTLSWRPMAQETG